ncbi:hypothetical protein L7F22_045264 [Adiantum nelumboides]|nr:hypothetical protein [Adiantum nelumboides]
MSVREFLAFQEAATGGLAAIRHLPFPVIAALHGPAVGGGFSLALAADIRLAAPTTKLSCAFVRVGLSCGELGTSYQLTRLVGYGRAAEIGFTGRLVEAEEAERIGLVNRVVPAEGLFDEADTLARAIAANSPGGIRLSKRAVQRKHGDHLLRRGARAGEPWAGVAEYDRRHGRGARGGDGTPRAAVRGPMSTATAGWPSDTLADLETFLADHAIMRGPVRARPIGDGHSNLTYLVTDGSRSAVVRCPPPPPLPPGAHDVLREARLLRGLAGSGVPVPEVLAVAEAGEVTEQALLRDDPRGRPGRHDPHPRRALRAVRAARRRAVAGGHPRGDPPRGHGRRRAGVGRAPQGFNARHLARMRRLVATDEGAVPAEFAEVDAWLAANVPPESGRPPAQRLPAREHDPRAGTARRVPPSSTGSWRPWGTRCSTWATSWRRGRSPVSRSPRPGGSGRRSSSPAGRTGPSSRRATPTAPAAISPASPGTRPWRCGSSPFSTSTATGGPSRATGTVLRPTPAWCGRSWMQPGAPPASDPIPSGPGGHMSDRSHETFPRPDRHRAEEAGLPERFFDRFVFNLHPVDRAEPSVLVGHGLHPRRDTVDGFAIAVTGTEQRNLRWSGELSATDRESCGPFRFAVLEPNRVWRIELGDNSSGVSFDLTWTARTPHWWGDIDVVNAGGETTRFSHLFQSGLCSGRVRIGEDQHVVDGWYSQRRPFPGRPHDERWPGPAHLVPGPVPGPLGGIPAGRVAGRQQAAAGGRRHAHERRPRPDHRGVPRPDVRRSGPALRHRARRDGVRRLLTRSEPTPRHEAGSCPAEDTAGTTVSGTVVSTSSTTCTRSTARSASARWTPRSPTGRPASTGTGRGRRHLRVRPDPVAVLPVPADPLTPRRHDEQGVRAEPAAPPVALFAADQPPLTASSRNRNFWILPVAVVGSSSTSTSRSGSFCMAMLRSLRNPVIDSRSASGPAPGRRWRTPSHRAARRDRRPRRPGRHRVLPDVALDLSRADVGATADDDVLEPPRHPQEALGVEPAQVTGVVPAVGVDRGRGPLRLTPVPEHPPGP